MKKNLVIIGIIILTIVLGVVSVLTALKLKELGTRPIAPSVPESKPEAQEGIPADLVPAPGCRLTFSVGTVLPTPTGTIRLTPTVTRGPTPTVTSRPIVTPTGTIRPTNTPFPTPTGTLVPTSTPVPSSTPVPGLSRCEYLQADKTTGSIPLTVHFKGKGTDPIRIKGFRFSYGDGTSKEFLGSFTSDQIQEVDHVYNEGGNFTALLETLDDSDHWQTREECQVKITVSGVQPTPTKGTFKELQPTPTKTLIAKVPTPTEAALPQAGLKVPTLGGIFAGFLLISLGIVLIF